MQKRSCAAVLLALIGAAAHAQENVYVGLGLGNYDYQENYTTEVLGRISDTLSSWKLLGGFEFNDNLAMEVSYAQTGNLMQSGTDTIAPFGSITRELNADFTITTLMAVGQVPLDWGVFFGGIGYFKTDASATEVLRTECCGADQSEYSFNDDGLSAKLGIEWRFGRFGTRYGIRLEYEWFDMDSVDSSMLGIGATYGF